MLVGSIPIRLPSSACDQGGVLAASSRLTPSATIRLSSSFSMLMNIHDHERRCQLFRKMTMNSIDIMNIVVYGIRMRETKLQRANDVAAWLILFGLLALLCRGG